MKKRLLNLGVISILPIFLTNINQTSNNHKPLIINQPLQKNVDDFQKLSNNKYLTTTKVGTYSNEELYLWNTNNKQEIDLNIKVLSGSDWSIGNNIFIASDGLGNSYIYDINNLQAITKTPINFLKGTGIIYSQKVNNNIYLVSFPDKNFHPTAALVDFSNINHLKYTLLLNNPFITNGNPTYIINNHSFIISVTAVSDWVYCDFSNFNQPTFYPLFNLPKLVLSSINNLSNNQMLVTINNVNDDNHVTQLWTINNKNPNLWIKQTIDNITIKDFITIKSNLAIISLQNQTGLFLLDYSNWNNLKFTNIANSQNIEMLDHITLFSALDLSIMNNQILFNDFNSNEIKILNFNDLNNITITPLNSSLGNYFAGFYQIIKTDNQQFVTVDQNQNFDLITLL